MRPALRTAVKGWPGFMDAAILDWAQAGDMPRTKLRDLLLAVFAGALTPHSRPTRRYGYGWDRPQRADERPRPHGAG